MSSELLLTVNLQGEIGGCVRSVDKQTVTVNVTPQLSKVPVFITREITHNDRKESMCFKTLKIQEEIVEQWESGECPQWTTAGIWKKLTKKQRILAWTRRFDEGFGVSYSLIN